MKRILVISLLLLLCVISACTSRKKEEELRRREARLNEKEQQLLLREKTLQFQEEELRNRRKQLDSVTKQLDSVTRRDTSFVKNANLVGTWNVRMTCIETTCPGSAVGDTKTEQWTISYQNNHVIARAMASDRLVRVYSGVAVDMAGGNTLELIEHRDSSALTYDTRMVVRLRMKDENSIEGQREIIRENDCKIVYALAMTKQ